MARQLGWMPDPLARLYFPTLLQIAERLGVSQQVMTSELQRRKKEIASTQPDYKVVDTRAVWNFIKTHPDCADPSAWCSLVFGGADSEVVRDAQQFQVKGDDGTSAMSYARLNEARSGSSNWCRKSKGTG